MNVVVFGAGGLFSRAFLDALGPLPDVVAVVSPRAGGRWRARAFADLRIRAASRDFRGLVRRLGVPLIPCRPDAAAAVVAALEPLRPDLLCVASFPYVLPREILSVARLGSVNVHPSLLPRHRGVDPVFWTFAADERETGVTLHWIDAGVDSGDVIAQRRVAVERGVTGAALTARLAREGAELLASSLTALEEGTAPRLPQDAAHATRDPAPSRAAWPVDFEAWPAERVWHFLRGVGTGRLLDASARPLPAGRAISFGTAAHVNVPGSAAAGPSGIRLYCRDGWVDLEPPTLRRRLRRALIRTGPR